LDGDHLGSAEDLDTTALHGHSDDRNTAQLGDLAEYGDATAINEDYEADYNDNDQSSETGETVTTKVDARDGDWETTASDGQPTQDDQEQYGDQHDAVGVDKHFDAIDLTDPSLTRTFGAITVRVLQRMETPHRLSDQGGPIFPTPPPWGLGFPFEIPAKKLRICLRRIVFRISTGIRWSLCFGI